MTTDETVPLRSDEGKLRQILLNLLSNAVKFTDQGRVETHLEVTEGGALFRVRDTGPGIPADKREEVFQPFARLTQKRERRGRNPQTGDSIEITARKVLTFKPSKGLKLKINAAS